MAGKGKKKAAATKAASKGTGKGKASQRPKR